MSRRVIYFLVLATTAAFFAGCSTTESRIRRNPELFAKLAPEQQEMILHGRIAIGFTTEMVLLALGGSDRIQDRLDIPGSEIWTYWTDAGLYQDSFRVIFRNGKVAAMERDSRRIR